jgi:glycosyltransferase involved in cell wall biosynthesis
MRVLFATNHRHLPQAVAGSQWTTDELCKGLATDGVRCAVLATLGPNDLLGSRTRVLAKLMGWSRVPPDRPAGYPVYRRWLPPQAVPEVKARFQPSVAVVMSGTPSILVEALLANSIPTIWYILDVLPESLAWQPSGRRNLAYLACSRFAAERARQRLGIEATVIPPIVDAQRYRVKTSRRSVIFVNPVPPKGVEIAIRLAERRPDIPFEFFESWEITGENERYRARARACANITWHKATLDIRQIYRRGRVLLAPSQWDEAWGRVVSEAQASGIPVIASRRGGLPEAVGPGGILVEAESDIAVWQEALSCLWDNAGAYSGYSAAALTHSQRPELDGRHVISSFKDFLWRQCRQIVHANR